MISRIYFFKTFTEQQFIQKSIQIFKVLIYEIFQSFEKSGSKTSKLLIFGNAGVFVGLFSSMKLPLVFKKYTLFCVCLLLNIFVLLMYKNSNKYRFLEGFGFLTILGDSEIMLSEELQNSPSKCVVHSLVNRLEL